MTLEVKNRRHYGKLFTYILDKEKAKAFRILTKRKTLVKGDITSLEVLMGEKIKLIYACK